ncbi:unnamed protein product [Peronospora belbahrii]|uniref:CCT domain-containing protein n=1 Tax=Peronospora belbahrii TaxID=622444 RepID=A0AAU9L0K1_9STRA|nr:unnamed protein product [Peronospora belbahrii]
MSSEALDGINVVRDPLSATAQEKQVQERDELHESEQSIARHEVVAARLYTAPVKMIGAYTPAARCMLLQKYMAKRARRLSQHKLRYGVRKALATARPRVNGRFVKTVQPLMAAVAVSHQVQH